jgi:hypothetical protein
MSKIKVNKSNSAVGASLVKRKLWYTDKKIMIKSKFSPSKPLDVIHMPKIGIAAKIKIDKIAR